MAEIARDQLGMILFAGVIWAWANMGFGANVCSHMMIYSVFALHNIMK